MRDRARLRMRIAVMSDCVGKAVRDMDAELAGLGVDEVQAAFAPQLARWEEIEALRARLTENATFPAGDSCCLVHDDPVFGELNPPDSNDLLYHYTSARTLAKIRKTRALRFRALQHMNDPHEALFSLAFQTGLMGPAGTSLVMSATEAASFKAVDWAVEINAVRRNVKAGSFSTDGRPDLSDLDPEAAEFVVPRRVAAQRGYAHPRMWAQYADNSSGVCIVLRWRSIREAVEIHATSTAVPAAWGPVSYDVSNHLSLGFFDARNLVRVGPSETLLQNFEKSLLTKHADWAHESEFRFLIMDGSPDDVFLQLPDDAVAGLVLGPRFDPKYARNVDAFVRTFGIKHRLRRLHWTHGQADLVSLSNCVAAGSDPCPSGPPLASTLDCACG